MYQIKELGPTEEEMYPGMTVVRTDFEFKSARGQIMHCSHFEPEESERKWDSMPCVIYMHGNSSSRLEALQIVDHILEAHMTLFCFDFAGCGKSEGEYISLGWFEKDDLELLITHLRNLRKVSSIALWGRSMGAATALMHANRDPTIAGLVADSSFANLEQLVDEFTKNQLRLPQFVAKQLKKMVQSAVQSRAKFDFL